MDYKHLYYDGRPCPFSPGKAVCVARNYHEHIKELSNTVPSRPIFFIKPLTSLISLGEGIVIPDYSQNCHHELELAVLIGKETRKADKNTARQAIAGYAVALDLTLRDVQSELKAKGRPWEIAKGFDGSCPISPFVSEDQLENPRDTLLKLKVNGETRQEGSTKLMITGIVELIAGASVYFTLKPGDVLLTGTPAGVGKLESGDRLELEMDGKYKFETMVKGSPEI